MRPYARFLGVPLGVVRSAEEGRDTTYSNVKLLSDALGLELYVGPPRTLQPAPEVEVDGESFATVARHDAQAAAGGGAINFDGTPIDHLAFSKSWLAQNNINPAACVLLTVRGKSMEPSMQDGDLLMVDRQRKSIKSGKVYVYNEPDNGTRVKRLELVNEPQSMLLVHSDNPDKANYPTEYVMNENIDAISQSIVGEVIWSGHKWN